MRSGASWRATGGSARGGERILYSCTGEGGERISRFCTGGEAMSYSCTGGSRAGGGGGRILYSCIDRATGDSSASTLSDRTMLRIVLASHRQTSNVAATKKLRTRSSA